MPQTKERKKGLGYFGQLKRPDGRISTELSIGITGPEFDWEETEVPSLVPTLTRDEIDSLLAGNEPTPEIVEKARQHALMRIGGGLSPFAQLGEQQPMLQKKKDDMARKPGESIEAYLKRVKVYMKKIKTTNWEQVEKDAARLVKEIRHRPGEDVITIESEQKRRDKIKKIFKKK